MKAWDDASAPKIAVSWDQDKWRRVVHISGQLTGDTAGHLESSIVGLGARSLVLDLDAVEEIDDVCAAVLADLICRLADGQVVVTPPSARFDGPEAKYLEAAVKPLTTGLPGQMRDPVTKSV